MCVIHHQSVPGLPRWVSKNNDRRKTERSGYKKTRSGKVQARNKLFCPPLHVTFKTNFTPCPFGWLKDLFMSLQKGFMVSAALRWPVFIKINIHRKAKAHFPLFYKTIKITCLTFLIFSVLYLRTFTEDHKVKHQQFTTQVISVLCKQNEI